VAEDHGGYIRLADRLDGQTGAEFIFSLPKAEMAAEPSSHTFAGSAQTESSDYEI
jgi:hypothetical protein